jgi:acyl dehydratase
MIQVAEASSGSEAWVVGALAPVRRHSLTRTDLVRYAGASHDFNPMHHDEVAAMAEGLPSVFGHGMLSAALLAEAVTDFVGLGSLVSYSVRFTKQTWPGDVLLTHVEVVELRPSGDGGQLADLKCALLTDSGATVVRGTATARVAAA